MSSYEEKASVGEEYDDGRYHWRVQFDHASNTYELTRWSGSTLLRRVVSPAALAEEYRQHLGQQWILQNSAVKEVDGTETRVNEQEMIDAAVDEEIKRRQTEQKVAERMRLIEAYGEDEFEDGQVLVFVKEFPNSAGKYTYAAVKAGGYWYTSGNNRQGAFKASWHDLVGWLIKGVPVTEYAVLGVHRVVDVKKSLPKTIEGATS